MKATVDVTGLPQLNASLGVMRATIANPVDALQRIYDDWLKANRARFGSGGVWPELAPATKARKRRQGKPTSPLAGGPLEVSETRSGAPNAIRRIKGSTLTMGTSRPEANLMKGGRGTPGSRGYMPKRNPVVFDRSEQLAAAETLGRSIIVKMAGVPRVRGV